MVEPKYIRHILCRSRNQAGTDLLTLQFRYFLALLVIHQERNLFINVLALLYGDLRSNAGINVPTFLCPTLWQTGSS